MRSTGRLRRLTAHLPPGAAAAAVEPGAPAARESLVSGDLPAVRPLAWSGGDDSCKELPCVSVCVCYTLHSQFQPDSLAHMYMISDGDVLIKDGSPL
jgi:hypothetical protein